MDAVKTELHFHIKEKRMKVRYRNVVANVSFLLIRQCVDVYMKAFLEHTALLAPWTWTTCSCFFS